MRSGDPEGRSLEALPMSVEAAMVVARQALLAEAAAVDAVADPRDVGVQPQGY